MLLEQTASNARQSVQPQHTSELLAKEMATGGDLS